MNPAHAAALYRLFEAHWDYLAGALADGEDLPEDAAEDLLEEIAAVLADAALGPAHAPE